MGNFAEELIKGKKFVRKGQHWWGVGNPKKIKKGPLMKPKPVKVKGVTLTRAEYRNFVKDLNRMKVQKFTKQDVLNWLKHKYQFPWV